MSRSRHFTRAAALRRTESTATKIKHEDLGTFDSEIKKFDKEHQRQRRAVTIATASKTRKRSIKHVKLEYENNDSADGQEHAPDVKIPDNFFPIYNKIKEMRELIITPVDLIGCVKIPALLTLITDTYRETGVIRHIEISEIPSLHEELKQIHQRGTNRFSRYQLLVTLLFSSQTKDEANFQVMQSLHAHYLEKGYKEGLCIESINDTDEKELDKMIFQIGFHSRKAAYLKETTASLQNGDIPDTIEELVKLKGIGYKMGHLILQGAWHKVVGISVDTHMVRLCNMFGWVPKNEKNPDNIREILEQMLVDHKEMWNEINPVLVGFGQSVCTPVGRRCDLCLLSTINEKNDVLCPAVDKKLLLRVKRGVERDDRKIRGDLEKLVEYINS